MAPLWPGTLFVATNGTLHRYARRAGYVQDINWFALQECVCYANNTAWGLIDRYGAPKPSYTRFQAR